MNQRQALIRLWAAIEATKHLDWDFQETWMRSVFRDPAVRRLMRPQIIKVDPVYELELYNLMVLCQDHNLPCPIPRKE